MLPWYQHYADLNWGIIPTEDSLVEWLEQADWIQVGHTSSQEPLYALTIHQGVLGLITNPAHPFLAKRCALRWYLSHGFPSHCTGFVKGHNTSLIQFAKKHATGSVHYDDDSWAFVFIKET